MKRGIKLLLLWLAKYSGAFALTRFLTRNGFVVVAWHGVSADDEHRVLPEYFVPVEVLSARLAFLASHFRIVSLDEIVRQHAAGSIQPRQVVLTFDDGLTSFGRLAAPLLEAAEAPATVYAVTARMEQPLEPRSAVKHLLLLASREALRRSADRRRTRPEEGFPEAFLYHSERLRELDTPACREYLLALAAELDVDFAPVLDARVWEHHTAAELHDLSLGGFDVQVHSHEHRTVIEDPDGVREQSQLCRDRLEATTGRPATDYCYPSGLWTRDSWVPLREAGMRSATTCRLGPNFATTPALALRRYIDHSGISQLEFEAMVSGLPWLLHVLLHPSRFAEPSEARVADGTWY